MTANGGFEETKNIDQDRATFLLTPLSTGAIHTLESSIVPSELIFTARKYLIGMNATKFVSLLDEYGLSNYIDDPSRKCTFLAPSNEAFEEVDYASGNFTKLLLYHILPQAWLPKDLDDGLLIDTELIEHKLNGSAQKLKVAVENEDGSIPIILKPKDGKSITFGGAFVNGEPGKLWSRRKLAASFMRF
jgi:hypothetical protein